MAGTEGDRGQGGREWRRALADIAEGGKTLSPLCKIQASSLSSGWGGRVWGIMKFYNYMSGNELGTLQREGDEVGGQSQPGGGISETWNALQNAGFLSRRQALDLASRCIILAPTLQALAPWAGHSNAVGFSLLLLAAVRTQ